MCPRSFWGGFFFQKCCDILEVGLMYNMMSISWFDRVSFGGNNGGRRPNTDALATTSAPAPCPLTKYLTSKALLMFYESYRSLPHHSLVSLVPVEFFSFLCVPFSEDCDPSPRPLLSYI